MRYEIALALISSAQKSKYISFGTVYNYDVGIANLCGALCSKEVLL
jgi:hypothetical protein